MVQRVQPDARNRLDWAAPAKKQTVERPVQRQQGERGACGGRGSPGDERGDAQQRRRGAGTMAPSQVQVGGRLASLPEKPRPRCTSSSEVGSRRLGERPGLEVLPLKPRIE